MNIQISEHFNYRKLIRFTVPTIAMMIFTSIYGVVDGVFVSNFVGSEAFAAVNLIMPALMIMGSIGFMIGTGGSALVSKFLGEGKKEKANEVFSMLITVVIVVGGVLSIIGFIGIRLIEWIHGLSSVKNYSAFSDSGHERRPSLCCLQVLKPERSLSSHKRFSGSPGAKARKHPHERRTERALHRSRARGQRGNSGRRASHPRHRLSRR